MMGSSQIITKLQKLFLKPQTSNVELVVKDSLAFIPASIDIGKQRWLT
jgi:hypothetical protein